MLKVANKYNKINRKDQIQMIYIIIKMYFLGPRYKKSIIAKINVQKTLKIYNKI